MCRSTKLGKREVVASLAVQKVIDSLKEKENGILKIRYLIGCGVNKIRGGGEDLFNFKRLSSLSIVDRLSYQ